MSGVDPFLCDDDLTKDDLSTILVTKGVSGAISLLACVTMIIWFCFCLNCNHSLKQRLPIGGTGKTVNRLVICMAVYAAFRSLAVILQTSAMSEGALCEFMGFMDQWSVWAMLLVIEMIVIYLIWLNCKNCLCCTKIRKVALCNTAEADDDNTKSCCSCCRGMRSKYCNTILQGFYFILPISIPLVFSWIPFIRDSYGLSGGWCWIRVENEDCSEFQEGLIEQLVFWFIPLVIFQILDIVVLLVYPCLVCRVEKGKRELCMQQAPLIMTLILSILINSVSLANRVAIGVLSSDHKNLGVWIFHAIASSCWGVFAAMVILFHMCTIRCCRSPRRNVNFEGHDL